MTQSPLTDVFARSLSSLMKQRGHNQTTLGKAAGVAPNTIANYLRYGSEVTPGGKARSPGLAEVEKIAAALGVQPLEMLVPAIPGQVMEQRMDLGEWASPPQPTLTECIEVLGATFREVNERVRRAAFSLLEGLCTRPTDASEIAEEVQLVVQAGKRRSA